MYSLDILGDWLYEKGNPFAQVQQLTVFEKLKKAVNEGYFEELIRKYLLENPHGCIMTLVPKKGLAAQREKELEESWKHTEAVFLKNSWMQWLRRRKHWKHIRKPAKIQKHWSAFRC